MDESMLVEMRRCANEGTPRPESTAVRAHSRRAFWAFADSWAKLYRDGVVDHSLKELCRVYVSRSVKCEYCGNQRSSAAGISEGKLDELMNFETSGAYDERQRAALSYAEAITWRLDPEEELVELGCFISLTMGQQSWIRLLNIEHHQVMAGSAASMAPGFESEEALRESKSDADYWATKPL
jgi:hypothetical protein